MQQKLDLPTEAPASRKSLNPNVEGLRPSSTLAMNAKCAQLKEEGRRIYQLGFGQSPFPVPPSVVEALRANAFQKDYLPVRGLPQLRFAVANYHSRKEGIRATLDDILIGPGTKELIFLLQLTLNGDLVIPSPSWVSYGPQANLVGRKVCWVDTKKENYWRLTPEALDELCRQDPKRPRLLILNYPNNPTGLTYSGSDLEALGRVARRYEIVVLSDEIYAEFDHSDNHTSMARYYPEGTIISSGISKWCGAGGWRLGSLCFPPNLRWLLEAMAVVASETYSAVSAPIQYAAVTALQGGPEIERYLTQSRRIIRALGRYISNQLARVGVEGHSPEGAYYLFPDFEPFRERLRERGITTSTELSERLLNETGVAILPGSDFGRPPTELTCRIAYVNFNGEELLAVVNAENEEFELSDDFLRQNCADVLEAFDIIAEWLK